MKTNTTKLTKKELAKKVYKTRTIKVKVTEEVYEGLENIAKTLNHFKIGGTDNTVETVVTNFLLDQDAEGNWDTILAGLNGNERKMKMLDKYYLSLTA